MKDVPDELLGTLRGRLGDLPHPGSSRWGKVALLATGTAIPATGRQSSLDFVQTGIIADSPIPIAVKFRFSTDGVTYTPEVPALFGGNVIVDFIEQIDMKSGPFKESFTLEPGDPMPICAVIARGLNVAVRLDAEDTSLFVEVVAAPTTSIDCADVVGPTNSPTTIQPFTTTSTARYPAEVANTYNLAVVPKRAYLIFTNQSTTANLFIHLGVGVTTTPGSEFATIILPPNTFAGYEVLNYTGEVYFKFDADDANGYTLVTQGLYP